jgi:branched-chain amino acid transport system ATP-binding protein
MLVEIKNITVYYSKSVAIQEVSLEIAEGEIVSIIGANGAGKSTIMAALTGLIPLTSGEIWFKGNRIDRKETTDIVRNGIVLVPEGRQLFPYLSVLSNLKLGASLRRDKDEVNQSLEYVYKLFPRLKERSKQDAGTLSGGEQNMLAIGRGLMANPTLLCMDEPSLGLAPIVVKQLAEVIKDINSKGVSILLVEQNVRLAFGVASKGYALQVGRIVIGGDIQTLKSSDVVKKAYLGG